MIIEIEVNGRKIKAKKGDRILDALSSNGIRIPTLCNMDGFKPSGACRICVVEAEGQGDLIPACSFAVEEWMKLYTHSPRVLQARRTILELLLANHPDGCLFCDRNRKCELQDLALELNVQGHRFMHPAQKRKIDNTSQAIVRDPSKCVLCGRCIRICEEQQAVSALDFLRRGSRTEVGTVLDKGLNYSSCVNCGQCILVCPTGALKEKSHLDRVVRVVQDKAKQTVALIDPAILVSAGEMFNLKSGKDFSTILFSALKRIGFSHVYQNLWGAEFETCLVARWFLEKQKKDPVKPVLISNCASFVQYVAQSRPELIPLLAPVKPSRQIMPHLLRKHVAGLSGSDPSEIAVVYITACTAVKQEVNLGGRTGKTDFSPDFVLTTRELFQLIRLFGINMELPGQETLPGEFGAVTRSGNLAAISGGYLESLVRVLDPNLSERDISPEKISKLRGLKEVKEFSWKTDGLSIAMASISGLANFEQWWNDMEAKKRQVDIVEVMACPGGCINGGGQPVAESPGLLRLRMKALYDLDDLYSGISVPGINDFPEIYEISREDLTAHFYPREIMK